MKKIILLLGLIVAAGYGCGGADDAKPLFVPPPQAGAGGALEDGQGAAGQIGFALASDTVSEGSAAQPITLDMAPSEHQGEVGSVSSSYYELSTGTGDWVATLGGLHRDSALYVYPAGDFSRAYSCSTASFQGSRESCDISCNATQCTFGLRVYGFEAGGTSFLLTLQ